MIRHIVFDVGRVLLHWDPELPYKHLIPDAERRRWFLDNVCTGPWNVEQDRGRSWEEGEALLIKEHPEHEALIRAYRRHWHEMVPHTLPETPEILSTLVSRGHDVTLLTNFATDTFAEAKERFAVLREPRGETVSGAIGVLKPDPAIYAHHTKTHDLDPAATLFFDDSPKNVAGANDAGWQGRLFTSAAGMRADLLEVGIEV